MILHWGALEAEYGAEVAPHRAKFESAAWDTYAMLCHAASLVRRGEVSFGGRT
jgi:hypothetical protein